MSGFLSRYASVVRVLVYALLGLSGLSLFAMIVITCADVILRVLGYPIKGSYDLICVTGAITIACALPYTTAVKGHVAIEFFFLKLRRTGRIIVDSLARIVAISLFTFFAWESVQYGNLLRQTNQVSTTLKFPTYWVAYVIALSCASVVLIKIYHLLRPGRAMIEP